MAQGSPASATTGDLRRDKSGDAFWIRPFQHEDHPALIEFYERFEPKRCAQGLPPAGRDRVVRWLDSILASGVHLLAHREGPLIGHAFIAPLAAEQAGEYAVFLSAEERGRGVGTELNRAAMAHARAAGFRRLWLTVEPHNRAAIRSYEKVGFRFLPGTIFSLEAEMELDLAR